MTKREIGNVLGGIGVDSFNRFQKFLDIMLLLKGQNYWYALQYSYQSSDNLFAFSKKIKECFLRNEPKKHYLITLEERNYLKQLPNRITIYRGMTELELKSKQFGCSWTLKKEIAEFFAYQYARNFDTAHLTKTIHEITIDKRDVIAFFNGRKEFEIIYINDRESA